MVQPIRLCTGRTGSKCQEHGKKITREPDPFTAQLAEPGEEIPDAIGCEEALDIRWADS